MDTLILLSVILVLLGVVLLVLRSRPAEDMNVSLVRVSLDQLRRDLAARDHTIRHLKLDVRNLLNYGILVADGWRRCNPNAPIPPLPSLYGNGETPTSFDVGELQQKLRGRLDLGEWGEAAMQIDSRFDGEGYRTSTEFSEHFLRYLVRHGRLPRLLRWLADNRPDIQLGNHNGQ